MCSFIHVPLQLLQEPHTVSRCLSFLFGEHPHSYFDKRWHFLRHPRCTHLPPSCLFFNLSLLLESVGLHRGPSPLTCTHLWNRGDSCSADLLWQWGEGQNRGWRGLRGVKGILKRWKINPINLISHALCGLPFWEPNSRQEWTRFEYLRGFRLISILRRFFFRHCCERPLVICWRWTPLFASNLNMKEIERGLPREWRYSCWILQDVYFISAVEVGTMLLEIKRQCTSGILNRKVHVAGEPELSAHCRNWSMNIWSLSGAEREGKIRAARFST